MYPLSTLLGRNKSSMQGTQSICGLHSTLCGIHRQDWQGLREGGASRVLSMISKFKGLEEKGTCCAKYPLNTRNGIRAVDRRADLRLRQEGKGGRLGIWRDTQASSSALEEQFWATKVKSSTTGKHSWLHQKVPLHHSCQGSGWTAPQPPPTAGRRRSSCSSKDRLGSESGGSCCEGEKGAVGKSLPGHFGHVLWLWSAVIKLLFCFSVF